MCEEILYGAVGAESYFEVCPSEYIADVGSFLTYIGENSSSGLRCW